MGTIIHSSSKLFRSQQSSIAAPSRLLGGSLLLVIGSSSLSSFLVLDSLFFSTWVLWYWFFVLGSLFLVFRSSSSISILGSWVFFLVIGRCSLFRTGIIC